MKKGNQKSLWGLAGVGTSQKSPDQMQLSCTAACCWTGGIDSPYFSQVSAACDGTSGSTEVVGNQGELPSTSTMIPHVQAS